MKKSLYLVLTAMSVVVILFFLITLLNQLFGLVDIVARYHEGLSQVVFVVVSLLILGFLMVPVWFIIRLPSRLEYPSEGSEKEVALYRQKLAQVLDKNKHITQAGMSVTDTNLEEALMILEKEARKEINRAAGIVFVSTAISQSGKLDSFVVLALLTKMVWRVAHIYNQRPALTDLARLYANVAGTTLIAANLDEIDISEQMEPVMAELVGSTALSAVPGMSQITAFGFSCVMEGSVNAFLALRMGEVAIGYSGSITKPERSTIRKSATLRALVSLRVIIKDNGKDVLKALFSATRKRFSWFGQPGAPGSPMPADAPAGEVAEIPPKEQNKIIQKVLSFWSAKPVEEEEGTPGRMDS